MKSMKQRGCRELRGCKEVGSRCARRALWIEYKFGKQAVNMVAQVSEFKIKLMSANLYATNQLPALSVFEGQTRLHEFARAKN
jgi:hypothetical protein